MQSIAPLSGRFPNPEWGFRYSDQELPIETGTGLIALDDLPGLNHGSIRRTVILYQASYFN